MAVPALGTTRAQHAHTHGNTRQGPSWPRLGATLSPTSAGLAVAVPGLWGHSWGSSGCVDGMGKTRPPPELCWLGRGDEDDDGIFIWGGWRPSGTALASPRDSPFGWDARVLAEEDPMASAARICVQPQAPGEDSAGLGGWCESPSRLFEGDSLHGSTEVFLPSILPPSYLKKSI